MLDFSQPDAELTPEQKKRKRRNRNYAILAFELFILLCIKGADWAEQIQIRASLLNIHWSVLALCWLIIIPTLYILVVFIHESGHIVGAWLGQFRILKFIFSWLQISKKSTKWEVCLAKPISKMGGMVLAIPSHSRNLRSRNILLIASGPAANLLTGGFALYLHHQLAARYASAMPLGPDHYWLFFGLLAFGWISIAVGSLNLLPIKLTSGHMIDGRQLLQLVRGGPAMHQQLCILQIQSLDYAGTRPREWGAEVIEKLLAQQSQTVLDCYAHVYAYSYFHDCNDLEQLRFHLDRALDHLATTPVALQQYLLTQAAYVAALHTNNAEQARYWLNRAQELTPFKREDTLFAQAAVAYAEGELHEAEKWLHAAVKNMQKGVSTGSTTQAAERMHDLQLRIEQAKRELGSEEAVTA